VATMAFSTRLLWLSVALSLLESICLAGAVLPRDAVPSGFGALPYYPAPHGGWVPSWKKSYAKAQVLVSQMTLAEKTNITGGAGMYMVGVKQPKRARLQARLTSRRGES
jgi:hypothetical protein